MSQFTTSLSLNSIITKLLFIFEYFMILPTCFLKIFISKHNSFQNIVIFQHLKWLFESIRLFCICLFLFLWVREFLSSTVFLSFHFSARNVYSGCGFSCVSNNGFHAESQAFAHFSNFSSCQRKSKVHWSSYHYLFDL